MPASSSPATSRAPRATQYTTNIDGSSSVNSSAFMNPVPVVIASRSNIFRSSSG